METAAERLPGEVLPAALSARGIGDAAGQAMGKPRQHTQAPGYGSQRVPVRAWLMAIARDLAVGFIRGCISTPTAGEELPVILIAVTGTPGRYAVFPSRAPRERRAPATPSAPRARAAALAPLTAWQIGSAEGSPLDTAQARTMDGTRRLRATCLPGAVGDG